MTTKTQTTVETYNLKGIEEPEDAMEKMGLVWEARQEELFSQSGISIPNHKAIVRSDNNKILGVMGKDYNPTQLNTYFSQFDSLTKSLNLTYDKGRVFNGGQKVILTASFPKTMMVRVNDECRSELNWGTSFDGTMGNTGWFTVLRLVCTNGLTRKAKEQQFSCKHTKNSELLIKEKMEILLQSEKYFQDFLDCSKRLANKIADRNMVNEFIVSMFGDKKMSKITGKFDRHFKTKRNIKIVKNLFRNGKGNGQGTAWDLYNGYTEWIDHERTNDDNQRIVSSLIGSGSKMKEKAFESLVKLSA